MPGIMKSKKSVSNKLQSRNLCFLISGSTRTTFITQSFSLGLKKIHKVKSEILLSKTKGFERILIKEASSSRSIVGMYVVPPMALLGETIVYEFSISLLCWGPFEPHNS